MDVLAPPAHPADQDALWAALARGDLQVVSSDHAPYRFDETGKLSAGPDAPFPAIANGMPGLEVRLPLMFDAMVSRGRWGSRKFRGAHDATPARLYGLTGKGHIAPGYDADLTLWDPRRYRHLRRRRPPRQRGLQPVGGHDRDRLAETRPSSAATCRSSRTAPTRAPPARAQWLHRAAIGTDPAHITGGPA
jgi:dihydropyrimidinase